VGGCGRYLLNRSGFTEIKGEILSRWPPLSRKWGPLIWAKWGEDSSSANGGFKVKERQFGGGLNKRKEKEKKTKASHVKTIRHPNVLGINGVLLKGEGKTIKFTKSCEEEVADGRWVGGKVLS